MNSGVAIPVASWKHVLHNMSSSVQASTRDVLLSLLLDDGEFVLLEGVSQQVKHDQFTYLGIRPYLIATDRDGTIHESYPDLPSSSRPSTLHTDGIYTYIRHLLARYHRLPPNSPPFSGGIMGMLSYESAQYLERIPFSNPRQLGMPHARLMIPKIVLIKDNHAQTIRIVYSLFTESIAGI